ncbi:hypothetical protein BBP40_010421 [Aspergillus hancockii]|nr:hypothetical protein BBP40_010421 [Aspergillus hancockii]
MRLCELHLHGVRVSSALFWPSSEESINDVTEIKGANLEILEVIDVPPHTPDGKWILDHLPERAEQRLLINAMGCGNYNLGH